MILLKKDLLHEQSIQRMIQMDEHAGIDDCPEQF